MLARPGRRPVPALPFFDLLLLALRDGLHLKSTGGFQFVFRDERARADSIQKFRLQWYEKHWLVALFQGASSLSSSPRAIPLNIGAGSASDEQLRIWEFTGGKSLPAGLPRGAICRRSINAALR
jgi:hypothetical protein